MFTILELLISFIVVEIDHLGKALMAKFFLLLLGKIYVFNFLEC